MAKLVKIDGTVLGFPEKKWKLIDSNASLSGILPNGMTIYLSWMKIQSP